MKVLLNDLPNLPHGEGQEVLRIRDGNYELICSHERGRYWLYMFVLEDGKKIYTRMVRPAATVEDVRREGRWMLRQGHKRRLSQ